MTVIAVLVLGICAAIALNYVLSGTVDKWRNDEEIED